MGRILIIEDDIDTAKMVEHRIAGEGFKTEVVNDAYGGIAAIRKGDVDLIVLDIMLPAGGGMSILQNIKLFSGGRDVPVVVLTGIRDEDYKKKLMDMGAKAYIEKPYDAKDLISTIKALAKSREG